jgi:hypothetical protein
MYAVYRNRPLCISLFDKTNLGNCTLSADLTLTLRRVTYVYVLYARVLKPCLAHLPAAGRPVRNTTTQEYCFSR